MRQCKLFLLLLFLGAGHHGVAVDFPLEISKNKKYFVDNNGDPFFYHADTGWQIFSKLTTKEAREYLMHRKEQGFNTIQTIVTMNPGLANRYGELPFDEDNDFTKPNKAYYEHVSKIISIADSLDLLITMAQPWVGCCGEGYGGGPEMPIRQNGPEKNKWYGSWLGKFFSEHDNLWWIIGGDSDPKGDRKEIMALAAGLHETAPGHQLLTYHASTMHSSTDLFQYAEWLDLSMVYTYWRQKPSHWVDPEIMTEVYEVCLREYNKSDTMPFILGESQYEGFHGNDIGTPHHVRRQAWWTMLCGGAGHAYGSEAWNMPDNWKEILDYPGAWQLKHLIEFFEQIDWWTLIPDQRHKLVVKGYGEWTNPDYVTVALSEDKALGVAYMPERTTLVVDFKVMEGNKVKAQWYSPVDGKYTDGGQYSTDKMELLTPPDNGDWTLLLKTVK